MYSQIGQVTPGQKSSPILATPGKESDNRDHDTKADRDSFQSVMSATEKRTDQGQIAPEKSQTTETTRESDDRATASDEVVDLASPKETATGSKGESSETSTDGFLPDADEIVFKTEDVPLFEPVDDIAPPADPADGKSDSPKASDAKEVLSEVPAASSRGTKADVPAWFVAPPKAGETLGQAANPGRDAHRKPMPEAQAATPSAGLTNASRQDNALSVVDAARATAQPANDVPPPALVANTPLAQGQTGATTPGQTAEAPGLLVKAAVAQTERSGNAGPAATVNPPGSTKTETENAEFLATRRGAAEETSPAFATRRTPQAMDKPAAAVAAAPPPSPAIQGDTGNERAGIRWFSEVGFSSEVAAQELPATARLQQATLLQQPDLPRNVAVQLAQAMRQGGAERPMDLVLNPAELGRVRISMQAGDGTMAVQVLADRPETLDLMRRHIDVLAQEFHDIGFGTAEFSFGQNTPDGDGPNDSDSGRGDPALSARADDTGGREAPADHPRLSLQSDRVDIRL